MGDQRGEGPAAHRRGWPGGVHYAPGAHTSPQWPGVRSCRSRPRHTGSHLRKVNMPVALLLAVGSPGWGKVGTPPQAGPITHQAWPLAHSASGCSWQRRMSTFRSGGRSVRHCGHQDRHSSIETERRPGPRTCPPQQNGRNLTLGVTETQTAKSYQPGPAGGHRPLAAWKSLGVHPPGPSLWTGGRDPREERGLGQQSQFRPNVAVAWGEAASQITPFNTPSDTTSMMVTQTRLLRGGPYKATGAPTPITTCSGRRPRHSRQPSTGVRARRPHPGSFASCPWTPPAATC